MYGTFDKLDPVRSYYQSELERLRGELDDLRLLNTSLLREAQAAKNSCAAGKSAEAVPKKQYDSLQREYEKVGVHDTFFDVCVLWMRSLQEL